MVVLCACSSIILHHFFCEVKKLASAFPAMATHSRLYLCLHCGKQMSSDYLCMGCGLPIHWFCSTGDPAENEGKGHGAHYWCRTCHAKKVEPGSVLRKSSANQRAIANSARQQRTACSRTTVTMVVASESVPPTLQGTVPDSIVPESVPPSLPGTVPDSIVPESVPPSLQGTVPDSIVQESVPPSLSASAASKRKARTTPTKASTGTTTTTITTTAASKKRQGQPQRKHQRGLLLLLQLQAPHQKERQ